MNNREKIHVRKKELYEELLDMVKACDITFQYKGVGYNITKYFLPCITLADGTKEEWLNKMHSYSTYEELLQNHVMDDGTHILDVFDIKDENIFDYI